MNILEKDKFTLKELDGVHAILCYMFYASYRIDVKLIHENNKEKIEILFDKMNKLTNGRNWTENNILIDDEHIFDADEKEIILKTIDCLDLEFPDPEHYIYFTDLTADELAIIKTKLELRDNEK
jgi:hypothetical protein